MGIIDIDNIKITVRKRLFFFFLSLSLLKMADKNKKLEKSIVAEEQIWRERVYRELKCLTFFTNYGYNPYNKYESVADKPNSRATASGSIDPDFYKMFARSQQTPKQKWDFPQTEAQEVGWYSQVLCPDLARDPRFYHPTRQSEVTKFMNEYFKLLGAQKMAANS